MLMLLPLIALSLLILIILGIDFKELSKEFWVAQFLLAITLWGAFVVVLTEAASLLDAITQATMAMLWAVIIVLLLMFGWRKRWLVSGWQRLRARKLATNRFEFSIWIVFGVLAGLLLAVAWVAPPNNADVMQYHLPRVLQWVQSKNLDHFATIYDNQNTRPYWAELVILNLRVLYGSDRPSALLQWGSHLASMLAAAGIVKLLGGKRRSQWTSALFVFSLPMAVLQANTPKNDIVAGFWVLSLLYFVILGRVSNARRITAAGISLSLGLGMLSKGTFIPFAFPILILYYLPLLLRRNFSRIIMDGLLLVVVVVALNAGFWIRNFNTYGGPYGSKLPIGLENRQGQLSSATLSGSVKSLNLQSHQFSRRSGSEFFGETALISTNGLPYLQADTSTSMSRLIGLIKHQSGKLMRMFALNLMTPVKVVNDFILRILALFPAVFSDGFIASLRAGAWSYAMTTSNPVHIGLTLIAVMFVLVRWRRPGGHLGAEIGMVAVLGFFFMSFGGCSDWLICLRYQQGFFSIGAVLVAVSADILLKERTPWISVFLIIASLPYVLFNYLRPVIGHPPWPTRINSVFSLSADEIVFAHISEVQDEYEVIAARIQENECGQVGLSLAPRDFEYAFWWVLGAPDSGINVGHLNASDATQTYRKNVEATCAVICTDCAGQRDYAGIPLVSDYGHIQYFAHGE